MEKKKNKGENAFSMNSDIQKSPVWQEQWNIEITSLHLCLFIPISPFPCMCQYIFGASGVYKSEHHAGKKSCYKSPKSIWSVPPRHYKLLISGTFGKNRITWRLNLTLPNFSINIRKQKIYSQGHKAKHKRSFPTVS
jgi:hypothetical protein